jgi:hypothetical protein
MRHRPSGKSLIEMLVMISILSIIMGLSATTLASLFRLRHTITRDTEQGRSIDRLATRLRADAHEAVSAVVADDCILKLTDGRSIRYSFTSPRIVREVREQKQDREEVVHRDSFSIPRRSGVTFQSEQSGTGSLVRIVIEPENTRLPPRELPRTARIEAAVGIRGPLATDGGQP